MIPLGGGQRSDAEANRLVAVAARQRHRGRHSSSWRRHSAGSGSTRAPTSSGWTSRTAAWPRPRSRSASTSRREHRRAVRTAGARGATAICGARTSSRFPRAPASRRPRTRSSSPQKLSGGVEPGPAGAYALEIDSPTAVRTLNSLISSGVAAEIATAVVRRRRPHVPAPERRSSSASDKQTLDRVGKDSGLRFGGVAEAALPAREPRSSVPRIAVLTGGLTQEIWVLRDLGFTADPVATGNTSALNNPSVPDPLAGYDVVFNQAGWPAGATARARLTSFFARHGGYIGAGTDGTSVPHVGRPGRRPDGGQPRRQRAQRHRLLGQRRAARTARSSAPTRRATRRSWTRRRG